MPSPKRADTARTKRGALEPWPADGQMFPKLMEVYPPVNLQKKLWKITIETMGKSTSSMAMFNSDMLNCQRV